MVNSIVTIEDLRHPVPTEAHRLALARAEREPVRLTCDAVLAAARDATGLADFGPDDFLTRLQGFLDVISSDAELTPLGRNIAFQRLVKFASMRLWLFDLLRRHPEIRDLHVEAPIIIVGPWRSGTTHLHGLLAADSQLRSLRYKDISGAIPQPREECTSVGRFVRGRHDHGLLVNSTTGIPGLSTELLPHLAAMHPLAPNDVAEDVVLQAPNFPYLPEEDQSEHHEFMKTMLKALQWRQGRSRWVLKSPQYCDRIRSLLATFPGATIVVTHRDPVAVVQSYATAVAYTARLQYQEVDTDAVVARCIERIQWMLQAIMRDRSFVPDGDLVEVLFHDFMADEVGTVKQIYRTAGIEFTEEVVRRIKAFKRSHPRHRNGRLVFDLRRQFGVEPDELRKRFSSYLERVPVKQEVR